uniref:Uncharacterized protein n=1 Tax=Setaria viridis TaxID=4556 RepID=A0A4U6VDS2_SETVI|nr:hypothetical protein SEVIR_3G218000v2 [Setaria viridis]
MLACPKWSTCRASPNQAIPFVAKTHGTLTERKRTTPAGLDHSRAKRNGALRLTAPRHAKPKQKLEKHTLLASPLYVPPIPSLFHRSDFASCKLRLEVTTRFPVPGGRWRPF